MLCLLVRQESSIFYVFSRRTLSRSGFTMPWMGPFFPSLGNFCWNVPACLQSGYPNPCCGQLVHIYFVTFPGVIPVMSSIFPCSLCVIFISFTISFVLLQVSHYHSDMQIITFCHYSLVESGSEKVKELIRNPIMIADDTQSCVSQIVSLILLYLSLSLTCSDKRTSAELWHAHFFIMTDARFSPDESINQTKTKRTGSNHLLRHSISQKKSSS
jgi:hypothetical protein